MTLKTECCDVPIADDERFCSRCGWEARVKPLSSPVETAPETPASPQKAQS